jgi:hypothetical protein
MKNTLLILSAMVLFLAGCEQIAFNGNLSVQAPLTVLIRTPKSDPFCDLHPGEFGCPSTPPIEVREQTYSAGVYPARLSITSDREMLIQVGKQGSFKLELPKGSTLPVNGNFQLKAAQIAQPFDLAGSVATQETDSGTSRDRERCTYQEPYTECTTGPRGETYCHTAYRTVWGWQDVEYYLHHTDKRLFVSLHKTGSGDKIANYEGNYQADKKIYTYKGRCW